MSLASLIPSTFAEEAIFNGAGLQAGLEQASEVTGIATGEPRDVIIKVISIALSFASLLAVAMVIIAGFWLLLSLGDEEKKEKAKKIIFYTLIGLMVLLFSRIIVGLVTLYLATEVGAS